MVNHRARSGFVVEKHVKKKILKGKKNINPPSQGLLYNNLLWNLAYCMLNLKTAHKSLVCFLFAQKGKEDF